jgi:hypothetical protein
LFFISHSRQYVFISAIHPLNDSSLLKVAEDFSLKNLLGNETPCVIGQNKHLMATYCHETKERIVYGTPFYILTRSDLNSGAILSHEALQRIPPEEREGTKKTAETGGMDVHAAASIYSKDDSYSMFNITKEEFLYSISEDTLKKYLPTAYLLITES